jgi:hypothetical protein
MTDDDLISNLAMILQTEAMNARYDDDTFIVYATAAVEFLKQHYASVAKDTGYYEGEVIADLILGRSDD